MRITAPVFDVNNASAQKTTLLLPRVISVVPTSPNERCAIRIKAKKDLEVIASRSIR
ncbi:hypothetical protein PSAB6_100279 [Paraburkholderia sabiae]|nr:hypothetical protein PSAB6_100279 [Paraburkholderia sabiae]